MTPNTFERYNLKSLKLNILFLLIVTNENEWFLIKNIYLINLVLNNYTVKESEHAQEFEGLFGSPPPFTSVGIHEHYTVAEILAFGRETGFSTQTLQRWYMYKLPQETEANLLMFYQSCSWLLNLDSRYKWLLHN